MPFEPTRAGAVTCQRSQPSDVPWKLQRVHLQQKAHGDERRYRRTADCHNRGRMRAVCTAKSSDRGAGQNRAIARRCIPVTGTSMPGQDALVDTMC